MYPKDDRGEYQVLAKWIDAWKGGGGSYVPGYTVVELRRYADGDLVQHVSERVVYIYDASPEIVALHFVYMAAQAALIHYLENK